MILPSERVYSLRMIENLAGICVSAGHIVRTREQQGDSVAHKVMSRLLKLELYVQKSSLLIFVRVWINKQVPMLLPWVPGPVINAFLC